MDRRERIQDPIEAIRTAMEGNQAEIWTALPAIVQSYNPASLTISAQPAVRGQVQNEADQNSSVSLPLLADVPVVFPCGGGFILTYPIKPGDECLVIFASRCIDAWWQSGGEGEQMDSRMHDLSDGFAIVGPRSQAAKLSPPAHAENTQLRSDDGENFVEISPAGELSLKAKTSVTLDAPEIFIKGALTTTSQQGGATVATFNGTLNASQDVSAAGISLHNHDHQEGVGRPC